MASPELVAALTSPEGIAMLQNSEVRKHLAAVLADASRTLAGQQSVAAPHATPRFSDPPLADDPPAV